MKAIVAWMVRNGVAANLLMLLMLMSGFISFLTIPVQVFPEFSLDMIEIRVEYPGASPNEIQSSVIRRIEEQIEGVDGIYEITATASEGAGTVRAELAQGEDVSSKLDEIKAEVDRITTFPADSEKPEVREMTNRSRVVEIGLVGDVPERTLRELAHKVKDDLSLIPDISFVDVYAARDYEVSIEISNETLRAYKLSLPQVANIVAQESLDLPGGEIETLGEEINLRTLGRNYTKQDFDEIVVLTAENGAQVKLSQIGSVLDGFQEDDLISQLNSKPVVFVRVYRIGDERVQNIIGAVQNYLQEDLRPTLPPEITTVIWQNDARELADRVELLLRNGGIGLLLVVLILSIFLDLRIAFWTSMGIFISFVGAFTVMALLGLTINQMSLFGFILAIGIVVDDAIVVGENIYKQNEAGLPPPYAAAVGAQRMIVPVFFAVSTTVAAFVPLLNAPGAMGKFLMPIPAVVIIVLALSLVEAMLILPRHLSHLRLDRPFANFWLAARFRSVQGFVSRKLDQFVSGPLDRLLRKVTAFPIVTIFIAISGGIFAVGIISGGYVKVGFFPEIEGTYVTATLELEPGTPIEETQAVINRINEKSMVVGEELQALMPANGPSVITNTFMIVGDSPSESGPRASSTAPQQSNKGSLIVELVRPENRDFSSTLFEKRWREEVGEIPGAKRLFFSADLVSMGEPIQIEIAGRNEESTKRAVEAIEAKLRSVTGVFDVRNDLDAGKREISISLKPQARTYGLTLQDLAVQVRAAFFGIESLRVQRGRDEIRVYVRLPKAQRSALSDLRGYRIRTPNGDFIPLSEVAELAETVSPSLIKRRNGRRIVSVTANLDESIIASGTVNGLLSSGVISDLVDKDRDLIISFGGEQRERSRMASSLMMNFGLALFVIYALLAISFRSYLQPIVVMSVIPFGIIGAILGHMVVGINITMPGIMGMVGLSGVIINGALVMVDFMNEAYARGATPRGAIIEGVKRRFRPVVLTALTTFFGVFPLILEQSVTAQFLVPVAVSLGFGVLIGTLILIFLVPAFTMLLHRFFHVFEHVRQDMWEDEIVQGHLPPDDKHLIEG